MRGALQVRFDDASVEEESGVVKIAQKKESASFGDALSENYQPKDLLLTLGFQFRDDVELFQTQGLGENNQFFFVRNLRVGVLLLNATLCFSALLLEALHFLLALLKRNPSQG